MMGELQPLAALCMDGRFADLTAVEQQRQDVHSYDTFVAHRASWDTSNGFLNGRAVAVP